MNWKNIDISKVRNGKTICPECSHQRKDKKDLCLSVDKEKGLWNCHHCGYKGSAKEYTPKKEYVKPAPRLEKVSKELIEYFESRGISNDTLLRMKITEANEWMPKTETNIKAICFNYFRDDQLVNIKFRTLDKAFKLSKDAELIFYNLDAIKGENTAVIVEGEIDCLSLIECGIYNVVSVPNGASKGSQKLEYLDNCWQEFEDLDKVIIATDNDDAGRMLKEELGRRIDKEKCWLVTYPEGCKDANEVLTTLGKAEVKQLIETAKEWPLEGIIPMEDMIDDIESYYLNGYPLGAASRVEGFDELLTFYPGFLTMVTGIPGHGKDEFTNELMTGLSRNEKWQWGVFNFEEPAAIHSTKLMEKFSKKAFAFRKNPAHRMNQNEFNEAVIMVADHFTFVNVGEVDVTMQGIIKKAIELVKRKGIKGMIINPWNYLEHRLERGQSETNYVSEVLTELINFLWKYGVHCFLIAHPLKIQKDKQTKKYEIPTLYSISGSANFFNKTHNGFCVYRNYENNVTDVYVQKVKWYWQGQQGHSSYNFNTDTRQYSFLESSVIKKDDHGLNGNWKPVNGQLAANFYETDRDTDEPF